MKLPFKYQSILLVVFLTSCVSQNRDHDCREYVQAIYKTTPSLGLIATESRDSHIQFLKQMAAGQKREGQIFEAMQLRDAKARQTQDELVKALYEVSENWQNQAQIVESLPETASSADRSSALAALNDSRKAIARRANNLFDQMDKYCKTRK